MSNKPTNYPGLDYSHGLSNIDISTNIRYGVISQNSISGFASSDIFTDGKDMAWERALKDAIDDANRERNRLLEEWQDNPLGTGEEPDEVDEDEIAEELGRNWESSINDYLYEKDGYKITGCLDNDLFILNSKYYTFAQFCSPCVPGAGNLDNPFDLSKNIAPLFDRQIHALELVEPQLQESLTLAYHAENAGFPKVYCLSHDWFESGKSPYPVFSVSTNELVSP